MQKIDLVTEEFSIEALEARFEMESTVVLPENDWKCTCSGSVES